MVDVENQSISVGNPGKTRICDNVTWSVGNGNAIFCDNSMTERITECENAMACRTVEVSGIDDAEIVNHAGNSG